MNFLNIKSLRLILWVWLGFVATTEMCQAEPINIAFFSSDSLTSTERCMRGAKKVLKRDNENINFHDFLIHQNVDQNLRTVDSVRAVRPDLIITIGSSATRFAKDNFDDIPIVFAAVKYPALSGFVPTLYQPGGNVTGASLNIPVDVQFKYFKRVIPGLKKIGVLYTDNTASLIPPASIVARQMGLELEAVKISDKTELPRALDKLARDVQGIWSVADPNLFDPQSTRYILLNAMRKGIPVMGFSRYVVESGALFALDFDYKAVGFQAGSVANRVLAGEKPGNIDVTSVDVIWFHYNEKTARHMSVEIPEELVAIAKEVYR
jgi:putative ABC transport system substrate-binding protein